MLAGLFLLAGCGCSSDSVSTLDAKAAATAAENAFAGGDYPTAILCCRQSLSQDAAQADVQVLLARAALRANDLETASTAAADAAALRPKDLAVIQIGAQVACAKDDLEAAFAAYTALAKDETLKPETRSIGWAGRAVVAIRRINGSTARNDALSSGDAARLDLLRAIQLNRRNASAYYHLGYLYQNTYGFKQAAIDQYDRYVGLMGESTDSHLDKAKEAIRSLKAEIAIETEQIPHAKSRNPTACADALRRADAARRKGDLKTAIRTYEAAVKADALSFDAVCNLAECLEKQGAKASLESAYRNYRLATVIRRGNARALLGAGRLAERLGYNQSAVTQYSKAVALKWNDLTALDGLIRSLRRCGNRSSANAYQRFRDSLSVKR